MADRYHIRHVTGADDVYVLCDTDGNAVPCQARTSLVSEASSVPTFIVEFQAGKAGLQVIDERGDP